jgi:hypothetical protein
MYRYCRRLVPHLRSETRLPLRAIPLLALGLCLGFEPAVLAKEAKQTICCRSSGGTRGTCLNLWVHLVPPSNRFNPGSSRLIAMLQGPSAQPTAMVLQLSNLAGDPVGGQMLPAQGVGVRLLKLPAADRPALNQPLVWESFPSCQPNKPPTRSILVAEPLQNPSSSPGPKDVSYQTPLRDQSQSTLAALRKACGGMTDTKSLLDAFGFQVDEWSAKLPPQLPVYCETLSVQSLGIR